MSTDPAPQHATVVADEMALQDNSHTVTETSSATLVSRPRSSLSPPASPPALSPSHERRRQPTGEDYYASRRRFDKLGNPIPERHRQPSAGAMASVYGARSPIQLPGDLGRNDPRRPRSPAPPSALPGDLGPNDPRRPRSPVPPPRSANAIPVSPRPGSSGSHTRHASDPLEGPASGGRLQEDPPIVDEERNESDGSDADNDNDTDADDSASKGRGRGRKRPEPGRTTSGKSIGIQRDESVEDSDAEHALAKPDPTKGESLLSFQASHPKVKITPPSGSHKRVHPSTAFDAPPRSGLSTPLASDDESHSELRAAQKLSMVMSAIHSTPSAHRVIRQILRGDYAYFQREAEAGRKRQRVYLVATDASPEAQYALEWTIGTVLRDGDTLFAVNAMDSAEIGSGGDGGVAIGQGADSVRDTAAIVKGLPATTNVAPPSPLAQDVPRSNSRAAFSPAESERRRAAEDITHRCTALLRRTRLQVRVVVEVFHCKSPRHTITEVIDFLSPTLVIIGSRGRSAVKGVLLGSFSNYLVTKSSQPVMVARKKLRKHGVSKAAKTNKDGTTVPYSGSGRSGRLSNVIEAPKGKGLRVKSWDEVGID